MTDEEFWKFSMDEMIHYDLPAEIDYILKHTKRSTLSYIGITNKIFPYQNIYFIDYIFLIFETGHSQGSLMMLGLMTISNRYAKKISPFIALSPVFYNLNMSLAIKFVTPIKTILR